jgi:uncharacterized protein (DUF433 family)
VLMPTISPLARKTRSRSFALLSGAIRSCYHPFMSLPERIVLDPQVLAGKPVVRGTRLAAEFILELLAAGQKETEILENYPGLVHEDILACLEYAHRLAQEHSVYSISA